MLSRNLSYFDPELCVDGHYIITGRINDQFCNDRLQLTDIRMELHRYLTEKEGFQAVFFLDAANVLYCYDNRSFYVLQNNALPEGRSRSTGEAQSSEGSTFADEIVRSGPMQRRRRQRTQPQQEQQPAATASNGALHMGRMTLGTAWQHVINVMKNPDIRCALVLNNVNALQASITAVELSMLEELTSYHQEKHSVIIYLFRDSSINTLLDSGRYGTGQWASFVATSLRPRIESGSAETNRVINLGVPNRKEIANLLNYLRFKDENPVAIRPQDISALAEHLDTFCGITNIGLIDLMTKISNSPYRENHTLSLENWREFVGGSRFLSPMERLNGLIGMENVKKEIKSWYALQERTVASRQITNQETSRFAPRVRPDNNVGHKLNVVIKGNPGTGKSTLADILGQIYRELGLLPQGHTVQRSSGQLISRNIGESAINARNAIQEALGGVLFIDEAYSLMGDEFGLEVINQIVNDLSEYQGQVAVILAGYSNQMDELLRQNDGLPGRFPTVYNLENYTPQDMEDIFRLMVQNDSENIQLSESLQARFGDFFEAWVGGATRHWGNARECETLLADMKKNCSVRMSNDASSGTQMILTEQDIPEKFQHCLAERSKNIDEALEKIDRMIGLTNIKVFLNNLVNGIKWGAIERRPGNYVFYGAPGTGKTTVARKIGEILGLLDILRRKTNNVVEVSANDLISGKITLSEAIENARGGVLFIDEAHQLGEIKPAGPNIIRALVPEIEKDDFRAETCVIIAGYQEKMRHFFAVDGGLERRFPKNNRIRFNDYTAEELVQILREMVEKRREQADEGYYLCARAALENMLEFREPDFGNGGYIRDTFLPESIKARTIRLNKQAGGVDGRVASDAAIAEYSEEQKHTLTAQDMPAGYEQYSSTVDMPPKGPRNAEKMLDELYGKEKIVEFIRSKKRDTGKLIFADTVLESSMHFAVCGNPGSGRHTVARAAASAWVFYGLLEKDDPHFVDKSKLEAGYVGQTAGQTQGHIDIALNGTLVVEYPSALLPKSGSDNTFGTDAMGVLIGAMQSHRKDLSVIFLDSKEGMEAVLQAYPMLRSLFADVYELEDLTPSQMMSLFDMKTKDVMQFEKKFMDLESDFFLNWVSDRGGLGENLKGWGNGKEIDRLILDIRSNWERMGGEADNISVEEDGHEYKVLKRHITCDMFPEDYRRYIKATTVVAEKAMKELMDMTGLHKVKQAVAAIERRLFYMKSVMPGCYCFLGNPGTGKTTVAKLMGGILKAAGALEQGHVISKTTRELCANPDLFAESLKLARKGILFIDEAHQLTLYTQGAGVIKQLLAALEDMSVLKDTCIILAGYPAEMMELLKTDEGLNSRFGKSSSLIYFEDYSPKELVQIMKDMAANVAKYPALEADYNLILEQAYIDRSESVFERVCALKDSKFGNARFVRNYLHDSVDEQLARLYDLYGEEAEPSMEARQTLTEEDIPAVYKNLLQKKVSRASVERVGLAKEKSKPITESIYELTREALSVSTVLISTIKDGKPAGTGTGTIISKDGYVLTCAHVVREMDSVSVRIYYPGMPGGDYRWLDGEICEPIHNDCDMALIKLPGNNFPAMPLRAGDAEIFSSEETMMLGYPLGGLLNGKQMDTLRISDFKGRISSSQSVAGIDRIYIDTTGLHGNSGSPVISLRDGNMIGVFSGSVAPGGNGNLDELNYFYPIKYFFERFVQ